MTEAAAKSPPLPGRASRNPIKIGDRFGRLVALDAGHLVQIARQRETYIFVRCDCGVTKDVRAVSLRSGVTRSCGCEIADVARVTVAARSITHGMSNTAIYGVYRTMLSRCYNPNVERYPIYGGRGIEVCDRWRGPGGFEKFLADMGPRPHGHSIERGNSDGNYEPGNCRWASAVEQGNNTSRNRTITLGGVSRTLAEWERRTGIPRSTIAFRIKKGWPVERALTAPVRRRV